MKTSCRKVHRKRKNAVVMSSQQTCQERELSEQRAGSKGKCCSKTHYLYSVQSLFAPSSLSVSLGKQAIEMHGCLYFHPNKHGHTAARCGLAVLISPLIDWPIESTSSWLRVSASASLISMTSMSSWGSAVMSVPSSRCMPLSSS